MENKEPQIPAAMVAEGVKNQITAAVAQGLNALPAFVILPILQNLTAEVANMQKNELEVAKTEYAEAQKVAATAKAEKDKNEVKKE